MLLALDTSGPLCSAALVDGENLLISRSDCIGRGHAEHLMPMLEEMLCSVGVVWRDLTEIACTCGPGSFTGLRVGLATARALALALDCQCTGVTVFEAFNQGETKPLTVIMDAKRGQVWMQVFDGKIVYDPEAVAVERGGLAIPEHVTRLTGSGAPLIAGQSSRFVVISRDASPSISAVAGAAISGKFSGSKPRPLYLRKPDAKPQISRMMSR